MDNKVSLKGCLAWSICALFYMYEFLLRTALGIFQPNIMLDLHLNVVQFSLLSATSYQLIYGVMQICVGIIVERFRVKWSLCAAIVLCGIACLGLATTHEFYTALFYRTIMGLGSSFGFICLLVITYDWMPQKRIAVFIGIAQFIGTLGPMFAAGPLHELSIYFNSWREVFCFLAIFSVIFALLTIFFVNKNPNYYRKFVILARPIPLYKKILQIIQQKQTWLIAIFSGSVYFSIEYLSANEGITFLMLKGATSKISTYMLTIAWLGFALGCPFIGYLSDKYQRRRPFIIFCAFTSFFALLAIIYLPFQPILTGIYFFILGLGASGSNIGFAIAAEHSNAHNLPLILGFNNLIVVFFSILCAPLIGTTVFHVAIQHPITLIDYQYIFIILTAFIMPAWITALGIKETFCKSAVLSTKLHIDKENYQTLSLSSEQMEPSS
ncbi:MAG TPA: MFS transporter [Legionellaceae bacterium]|nr:MFS transporter [Legionellaceae bacterium]